MPSVLGFALIAAAANLLGAMAVTSRANWSRKSLEILIAVSAGFMLAVSLLDIMPAAIELDGRSAAVVILLGYLLVHLTQHALVKHFHFGEETHRVDKTVGLSALGGLLLHTLVDGVAIASGFNVSEPLGLLVFFAILLHKFPEGLAVSSLFLAAGMGRGKALLAAATLGLTTILGVVITDAIGPLAHYGLALSGGVTLYVAASNLVPEFQSKSGWRLPLSFFAGCGLYFAAHSLMAG